MIIRYFDVYLQDIEVSKKQMQSYAQTVKWLERFELEVGQKLHFKALDNVFYDKFYAYYIITKGYSLNTLGKHIKNLKAFMRWAEENKLHNNKRYRRFKATSVFCDEPVLSSEELKCIYEIDFDFYTIVDFIEDHEKSRLDGQQQESRFKTLRRNWCNVVALYSSGCYPNDLKKLTAANIINNQYIKFIRHKKVNSFKEPWCIFPYNNDELFHFREVFEEMNFKFKVDLKSLYRDIKILMALAGVNKSITARSFRKTFASIWYFERGLDLQTCMKMTGHSRESSFKHYLNIDDQVVIDKILEKKPMIRAGNARVKEIRAAV